MSISWVAGAARARAMTQRRYGRAGARALAASTSLDAALRSLADGPYRHELRGVGSLEEAQRAVVAAVAWNCRVLAGWVPRDGVTILRVLAGSVEAADVVGHLRGLAGTPVPPPFTLGALATSWPRVRAAGTADDVRRALASSPWGDPGSTDPGEVDLALRASLVDRTMAAVPDARAWAAGYAALLIARELAAHRPPAQRAATMLARAVGSAVSADTFDSLRSTLPSNARWAVQSLDGPDDLWRAEAAWWARVDHEAAGLARRAGSGPAILVGAVALLAVDAWRVRAALEVAARGGTLVEVLDDVA